jgi:hypothetical protein
VSIPKTSPVLTSQATSDGILQVTLRQQVTKPGQSVDIGKRRFTQRQREGQEIAARIIPPLLVANEGKLSVMPAQNADAAVSQSDHELLSDRFHGLFPMIPCGAGCNGDNQSKAGQQLENFADFRGRLAPLDLTNQEWTYTNQRREILLSNSLPFANLADQDAKLFGV